MKQNMDTWLREGFRQPVEIPSSVETQVRQACEQAVETPRAVQKKPLRKLPALAATAVLCLLLVGTAVAVGVVRVEMDVEENGEIDFFYPEGGRASYAGAWEITDPPEGFRQTHGVITSFTPQEYGFSAEYAIPGETNERLYLFVNTLDGAQMGREFRKVSVNGMDGVLYYSELFDDVESSLVWSDPRLGLVFTLEYFGEQGLDLVSMGESVAACEYVPSQEETDALLAAIDALGDYTLTPPDGYEALLQKSAGEEEAAVQKIWGDALYHVVTLEYTALAEPAVAIRDYVVNLENSLTMDGREFVTVSGMDGCFKAVTGTRYGDTATLVWLDRETGLAFILRAEGLSREEMIALAESVFLQAE